MTEIALTNDLQLMKDYLLKEVDVEYMEHIAKDTVVNHYEDAHQALSLALQARKVRSTIEDSRAEIVKPYVTYQREIGKIVKDVRERLEAIETNLHEKIDVWLAKENENPFTQCDSLTVIDGGLSTKTSWEFEIVVADKVPREYTMSDDKKILEAINQGVRNIPGVRIYQVKQTNLRVKN